MLSQALAAAATEPAREAPMSLRDFLRRTGATLRSRWPSSLWIECAVVGCKPSRTGFVLELVDSGPGHGDDGQLRAFLVAGDLPELRVAAGVAFEPVQLVGMTAVLRLEPEFDVRWHVRARVVGVASALGEGLAARMREKAKAALIAQELYDRQRRLKAPADITRIAVIHPAGGAGFADVEREFDRLRRAGLLITRSIIAPFEGAGAAQAITKALPDAVRPLAGYAPDIVLLVRGGGSRSGLRYLDNEDLARAIAILPVPVLVGLGHAGDVSLADEVAYRSEDTPSKAAAAVLSLIVDPARKAVADLDTIGRLAGGGCALTQSEVDRRMSAAEVAAGRTLAVAKASVDGAWFDLRANGGLATLRICQLGQTANRQLEAALAAGGASLDRARTDAVAKFEAASHAAWTLLRIDSSAEKLPAALGRAAAVIARLETSADEAFANVGRGARAVLARSRASIEAAAVMAEALDPIGLVRRGFTIVLDRRGRIITDASVASVSRGLIIRFRDGDLEVSSGAYHRRSK